MKRKRPYVIYRLGNKELLKTDTLAPDEFEPTRELLAFENNCEPWQIDVVFTR